MYLIVGRTESFPFPFLSQGNFGEKPFPESLKAFPDSETIRGNTVFQNHSADRYRVNLKFKKN